MARAKEAGGPVQDRSPETAAFTFTLSHCLLSLLRFFFLFLSYTSYRSLPISRDQLVSSDRQFCAGAMYQQYAE